MNRSAMDSSFSTAVAEGSELAQAVGTAQNAATPGELAMAGFGAGVHQYLNMLLTQIYAKTTTLLAANMVLISLLLSTRASTLLALAPFYVGAVFFFALSAITSTIVLFPRLHRHDANGLLFWRAILLKGSPEVYYASVKSMDKAAVEEEYARESSSESLATFLPRSSAIAINCSSAFCKSSRCWLRSRPAVAAYLCFPGSACRVCATLHR